MYSFFKKDSPPVYHAVEEGVCEHEKCTRVIERPARIQHRLAVLPWILTVVFASLTLWMHGHKNHCARAVGDLGSYERGFATDFRK